MKSLDYIKQRISDGTTGLTDCNYDSMTEVNTVNIYEKIYDTRKLEHGLTLKSFIDERKCAEVYYDPNADFNYFSMSRNSNDGTLIFDLEAMKYALIKVLVCQTYNKAVVSEPVDMDFFNTHYFKYTVGDIVLCQEYGEEFSTEEKPWMRRRTTALLPIKFEVFEKQIRDFIQDLRC